MINLKSIIKSEITVSRSINDILQEIERKQQSQRKNKFSLIWEPINFKKIVVKENTFSIERYPTPINPLRGLGSINFDLISNSKGTKIMCSIDPYLGIIVGGISLICLFSAALTIYVLLLVKDDKLFSVVMILLAWACPIGVGIIGHKINRGILKNYRDSLLKELKLI